MTDIKIHINELGPVKNTVLTFKPFMLFTGESGLGKSYTAFLPYYLASLFSGNRLLEFFKGKMPHDISKPLKSRRLFNFKIQDLRQWMNNDISIFIGYLIGNVNFTCDINFHFEIPEDIIEVSILPYAGESTKTESIVVLINEKPSLYIPVEFATNLPFAVNIALRGYLSNNLFEKRLKSIIFPPARAAFMGANFSTLKTTTASVGMYNEFLKDLDSIRSPRQIKKDDAFFKNAIRSLIRGELVDEKGELYLKIDLNKQLIPITAAASSVKELSPLLLLLQNNNKLNELSVLFEEPEAHLHPLMQESVADLLARCLNKGMFLQTTTHSDYFLARINQLIRLGRLKKEKPQVFEQYCKDKIHNKNLYIDSSIISAYYFTRNGDGIEVIEQEVTDGIPFTTFRNTVEQQYKTDEEINKYLEH